MVLTMRSVSCALATGARRLMKLGEQLLTAFVALLMLGLVALIVYSVLSRYLLGRPVALTDELARLAFIWVVLLGAGLGVREGFHLGLSFIHKWLPEVYSRLLHVFASLLVVALAMLLVRESLRALPFVGLQRLPVTGLSAQWRLISVPLGAMVMIAYGLRQTLVALAPRTKGKDVRPQRAFEEQGPGLVRE